MGYLGNGVGVRLGKGEEEDGGGGVKFPKMGRGFTGTEGPDCFPNPEQLDAINVFILQHF